MTLDPRQTSGLLDTSVYIDLKQVDESRLPDVSSLSTITLAELVAGVHTTKDLVRQVRRQQEVQRAETLFQVLPFDTDAAHAYGLVVGMVRAAGRDPRKRVADQMIAAVAIAHSLPLYTRNPKDFVGLESVLAINTV